MQRKDDFAERRRHLANLSDEELRQRFWQLADAIVEPLIDLARQNTSPSIERSVLLRMGLSSLEADELVKRVIDHGLLSKGAGHVVYIIARTQGVTAREAAEQLLRGEGWDVVLRHFGKGA
ncbi:MAG: ornithine aminomutase subunit alpha [Bacillota bacterium]